ncbi:MAG: cell cycle transcriptional regulator TrcR [Alphaproteobacteria bacterium]
MALPLMPKATAVWLVENTALTFSQIAEFCGLHELEIQAIADGETAIGIIGQDPIKTGQLTPEEIARCEKNQDSSLVLLEKEAAKLKTKNAKYTSVAKRQDRPDAIAWILKHHPEIPNAQIRKLLGTTNQTIDSIKNKTHKKIAVIKPINPVTLGLCTEADLEKEIIVANARAKK